MAITNKPYLIFANTTKGIRYFSRVRVRAITGEYGEWSDWAWKDAGDTNAPTQVTSGDVEVVSQDNQGIFYKVKSSYSKSSDFKEFRWYAFERNSSASVTSWTDSYFHTQPFHSGNAYVFRAQYNKAKVWDVFCIPLDIAFNRPTSVSPVATSIRPVIPSVPASTLLVSNAEAGTFVPYDSQWKGWDDLWVTLDESSEGGNTATKYALKYPGLGTYSSYFIYSAPFRLSCSGEGIYGLKYYSYDTDYYEYKEKELEYVIKWDKTAPAWSPGILGTVGNVGSVDIDWTAAPADNAAGVKCIHLYRNTIDDSASSQYVNWVDPTLTFYEDSGRFNLTVSGTTYYYWGRAEDNAGNFSSYTSLGSASPISIPTQTITGFGRIKSPYNTLASSSWWGVRYGYTYKIFSVEVNTGTLSSISAVNGIQYSSDGNSWNDVTNPSYNGEAVSFPFTVQSDQIYSFSFDGLEDKEYWRVSFDATVNTEIDEVIFRSFDAAHIFVGEEMRLQEGSSIWSGNYDANGAFSGDGTRLSVSGLQYYDDSNEVIRVGELGGFLGDIPGRKGIGIGDVDHYMKYNAIDGLRIKGNNFTIEGGIIYGDLITWSGMQFISSIDGVYAHAGNIDLVEGLNITISGNDATNTISFGLAKWLTNTLPSVVLPDASGDAGTGEYAARIDHEHPITCSGAVVVAPGNAAGEGISPYFSRADHIHGVPCAAPGIIAPDDSAAEGSATSFARSDHTHSITCAVPGTISADDTALEGSATYFARSDHRHAITCSGAGAITPDASAGEGISPYFSRADHAHAISTAAAGSISPDDSPAEGSATNFSRSDHVHGITCATPGDISPDDTALEGSADYFSRSDHIHGITCSGAIVVIPGVAAGEGTSEYFARADHVHSLPGAAAGSIYPDDSSAEGSASSIARSDHTHGIACATPIGILPDHTAAEGSATSFSRSDHKHAITCSGAGAIVPDASASEGSANYFSRSDHVHAVSAAAPEELSVHLGPSAEGTAHTFARSDHEHDLDEAIVPTWTGLHTFDAGADVTHGNNLTFGTDAGLTHGGADILNLLSGDAFRSSNYVSGRSGWSIDESGNLEANKGYFRGELHSTILTYDEMHVTGGTLLVTTGGALKNNMTTSGTGTFYMDINDPESGHGQLFSQRDIVRIKAPYGGGVRDNWLRISGIQDQTTYYRYVCELLDGTPGTFYAGSCVASYGRTWDWEDIDEYWEDLDDNWEEMKGKCLIEITSDALTGPYIDMFRHHGDPWNSQTSFFRLGNINGTADYTHTTFGVIAAKDISQSLGAGFNGFILDETNGLRLYNTDIALYDGANQTVDIDNTGDLKMGTNVSADATTSFDFDSSTGALRVGELASSHANLYWASGALQIRNYETVVHELDTSGNVRFGEVGTGKSNMYFSAASGDLQLRDNTTAKITLSSGGSMSLTGNLSMGTDGAFRSGQTAYHTGTGFYMDYNAGVPRFSIGKTAGQYMIWNGSSLSISGTVNASAGYFGHDRARVAIESDGLNVGASGHMRGGQTAYDTGSGFWMGYNSGAYKFSVGNGIDKFIRWNGTDLTISGSVTATAGYFGSSSNVVAVESTGLNVGILGHIRGGQTDYATGNGFWFGYDGAYKASIGNGNNKSLTWDGSSLTISGTIQATAGYFGTNAARVAVESDGLNIGDSGHIRAGQTAYDTGSGFFLGYDTAYKLSIGDGSSKYLRWDGSDLSLAGSITIAAGSSGITNLSDAGAIATGDTLDDVPDGTSYGRVVRSSLQGNNVTISGCVGDLDDLDDGTTYKRTTQNEKTGAGRAYTGLDASNLLVTGVVPATSVSAGGAGLYLGSDYMGYYDSVEWKTYMDNSGHFYLGGTSGRLLWDGSDLSISGTVKALAGYFGASSSRVGIEYGGLNVGDSGHIRGGQTAYDTGSGFWLGYDTAFKLSIGDGSANYLRWDGSDLSLAGSITIAAGSSGIANLSDVGVLATADTLDDVPDGTSYGRVVKSSLLGNNVTISGCVGDLDDLDDGTSYKRTTPNEKTGAGRAYSGLDASNLLVTGVVPATNVAPGGAGLYLGADYLGYYDSAAWKTYMDNTGNFYLGGTSGHLQWDGASLSVSGTVQATGGFLGANGSRLLIETGGLSVGDTGHIRGGQTAYNTGPGFWMGYDSGLYKYSIGDPSSNALTWDGSTLTVSGTITAVGTFRTSDTGQRVILDTANNNLSWYNSSNALKVEIDDNLVESKPGIKLYDGVFYSYEDAEAYSELLADYFYMTQNNVAISAYIVNTRDANQNNYGIEGYCSDATESEYAKYRVGVWGNAAVSEAACTNIPIGIMGTVTDGGTATGFSGYFTGGDFYIKLGDNAGANKITIDDSDGTDQLTIDSNGLMTYAADAIIKIGDNAGVKKLSLQDSDGAEQFSVNSNGVIEGDSSGNVVLKLGDAAGANKLSLQDSAGAEQFSINSDGLIEGALDGCIRLQLGDAAGSDFLKLTASDTFQIFYIDSTGHTAIYSTSAMGSELLALDQNDIDQAFIDYRGTASGSYGGNLSIAQGDGGVDAPCSAGGSSDGWAFTGMVKVEINGTAYWMPYYSADPHV